MLAVRSRGFREGSPVEYKDLPLFVGYRERRASYRPGKSKGCSKRQRNGSVIERIRARRRLRIYRKHGAVLRLP